MASPTIDRRAVLAFRFRRHELDRPADAAVDPTDVALLDAGVQETGPDGARWALALRGAAIDGTSDWPDDLALAWTLRGAPHAYRRADLAAVAVATAPCSERDAAKRIFDASKPLKAADLEVLDALVEVATQQRKIVTKAMAKGELSTRLTKAVDEPFLRHCNPCNATHLYEQPFRLAALQAGLELEPGTSPPVLRRIRKLKAPMYRHLGHEADPRFDVVRTHLRFQGPISVRDTATYVAAPMPDVEDRWPEDAVEVRVEGEGQVKGRDVRFVLADDLDELSRSALPPAAERVVRLLGPFDAYLQGRDRELLVPDADHRKDLWRTLGRPGGVVRSGEVIGSWRPRASGSKLKVLVSPWTRWTKRDREAVGEAAEHLARHRGVTLAAVDDA